MLELAPVWVWLGSALKPTDPRPAGGTKAVRRLHAALNGTREHGAEGEGCQDRQARVPGLSAPGRSGFGRPRSDRLSGEPDCQAPTLTQAGVISGPVRDLVLLPGDVVAAGLVQLEGQGGHSRSEGSRSPTLPSSSAPAGPPIH